MDLPRQLNVSYLCLELTESSSYDLNCLHLLKYKAVNSAIDASLPPRRTTFFVLNPS